MSKPTSHPKGCDRNVHDAYEAGDSPDTGWHTAPRGAGADYPPRAGYTADADFTTPQASLPPPPPPSLPPPDLQHTVPELQHTAPELRHTAPELQYAPPDSDDRMQPRDDAGTTRSIPRPDERQAEEREAPTTHQRQVDVERAVPVGQQVRDSAARVVAIVRKSIPLRTVLFLLPPLALPALAFDLSVTAIVLVWLLLLWLAAAAGVFATMMLEGNLAMRSLERRVEPVTPAATSDTSRDTSADDVMQEALLTIGKQLDTLEDRIEALAPTNGVPPGDDATQTLSHRPQEHWSNPPRDEQYDRYGQTAVPDTDWSESRWRR